MESRIGDMICCNPTVKLKKGELYPVVNIEDISIENKYVYSKECIEYNGQSSSKFENGDTLFARITPCLENGKIAQCRINGKGFGSTELFVFRGIPGKTDNDYVYYLMSSKYIRDLSANSMTGASGRQRADLKFIKRIKWDFPTIPMQEKIVSKIKKYDDLIDINNNRILLLQDTIEEIYKEWFIRFRFPNHENEHIEKGIPSKWVIKKIKDYGTVITGKTPSTKRNDYYGNDYLFIKTPDMHDNFFVIDSEEKISVLGDKSQKKCRLPKDSIMVSCIGTGGVVSINKYEAHTNQQINSIVLDNKDYLGWLFLTLKSMKKTIIMFGNTGTTMTNLSKGKFENLKVLEPNKEIIDEFNKIVVPILNEIYFLQESNKNLLTQKELVLPKIMSGKVIKE